MDNTYILLSRSILDSEVFASQKLLKIWVWCLCKANYKPRNIPLKVGRGERTVKVKRGQFLFGRFKAEEELFIDGSTVYKLIKKLEKIGNIKIQSNNQYSIITIINYDHYQNPDSYQVTAKQQPSNSQATPETQPSNTTKKVNKVKKDNKIQTPREFYDFEFSKLTEEDKLKDEYEILIKILFGEYDKEGRVYENVLSLEKQIKYASFENLIVKAKENKVRLLDKINEMEAADLRKRKDFPLTLSNWIALEKKRSDERTGKL